MITTAIAAAALGMTRSTFLRRAKFLKLRPKVQKTGQTFTMFWRQDQIDEVAEIPKHARLRNYEP